MRSWLRASFPYLLLGVVTVLPYAGLFSSDHGFVGLDDMDNLVRNQRFQGLSGTHLAWMFTSSSLGVYEPVAWLVKALQTRIFGVSAVAFHLITLLLHVANAFLVLALSRRLFRLARPDWEDRAVTLGALLCGLLFAVHPLRAEVVAWASGQSYAQATLFALSAVWLYVTGLGATQRKRTLLFAGSVALYGLAVLSKSATVCLPLFLIALDVYPLRRKRLGRALIAKIPYFVIALLGTWVAIVATQNAQEGTLALSERIARTVSAPLFYLVKSVWPANLSPHYAIPSRGLSPFATEHLLALVFLVAVTAVAFHGRRRWGWLFAAWFGYVGILLPVAGLLEHGTPTMGADRYAYLSTVPAVFLVGGLWLHLGERIRPALRWGLPLLVLSLLFIGTARQASVWHDTESLWMHALDVDAADSFAGNNLGYELLEQDRCEEASDYLQRAHMLDPTDHRLVLNLGYCLEVTGRYFVALDVYERALEVHPNSPEIHNNLAVIYVRLGAPDEARGEYERALELAPDFEIARRGLEGLMP